MTKYKGRGQRNVLQLLCLRLAPNPSFHYTVLPYHQLLLTLCLYKILCDQQEILTFEIKYQERLLYLQYVNLVDKSLIISWWSASTSTCVLVFCSGIWTDYTNNKQWKKLWVFNTFKNVFHIYILNFLEWIINDK